MRLSFLYVHPYKHLYIQLKHVRKVSGGKYPFSSASPQNRSVIRFIRLYRLLSHKKMQIFLKKLHKTP